MQEVKQQEEVGKLGIYNVDIIHQRCKWKKPNEVYETMKYIEEKYHMFLKRFLKLV